jgi:hypothetical protein
MRTRILQLRMAMDLEQARPARSSHLLGHTERDYRLPLPMLMLDMFRLEGSGLMAGDGGLSRGARLGLGSGEEIFYAAAKVKERSRYGCADALKDEKSRAWIDVCVGLTLEGEAKRNEEEQGGAEIFQLEHHKFLERRISGSLLGLKTRTADKSFDQINFDLCGWSCVWGCAGIQSADSFSQWVEKCTITANHQS